MSACVVVTNASEARIFKAQNLRNGELELVKPLEHPASRAKNENINSDRPGHYQTDHSVRSAYEKKKPKQTLKEKRKKKKEKKNREK